MEYTEDMNVESLEAHQEHLIPEVNELYVPFGNYNDIHTIIASRKFYPVFITGLSGNGKTMMVEQICANLKREYYRINITIETDEDDLLGGQRLDSASTVWQHGPVVKAMLNGGVLLLDEVDLASTKIMCLQPILEGKPIYLKKINQAIFPAPGFTVIATANTKGQGSETGKFVGTNILNEAFLERFPVTFEQQYPEEATERDILKRVFDKNEVEDDSYINTLLKWAGAVRKTYDAEASDDVISTRRLVHIAEAYSMFRDRRKAIDICINRFNETTKVAFRTLYQRFEEVPESKPDKKTVNPVATDLGTLLAANVNPLDILNKSKSK